MTEKKVKITVEAKDKTSGELGKSRTEIEKTTATVKKNSQILAAHKLLDTKPYKDIQREMQQLQAAYNRLARSGKLSDAELYNAKQKLKEKTAELRKETGDWGAELKKAKAGIAGLAGAGYLFVKSFQQYSEFSQRMGEVNTLIDVSQERFASLGKEIRNLTKDIPQTASELAAAEYDIISAGVALEKSVSVLELSAKAAVAGVTDTKTAANAGIAVINAYGKSIDELDDIYDILFQTVKYGVTTFPQLAQSIGEVLPTARAAEVGIKEVGASIAALTKAGIRTPQAMTALKGAINALVAPAPEAKKQFEELGITWQGLIPTLDKIRKKSLSLDQLRLLIPDVEARTGVLALTQNFDSLVELLGEMDNAGGATQAAYEKMADTPENQMKLFKNEINDLMLSAGELVSVGLLPLAKAVRVVINSLKEADPVTKGIVLSLMGASAGFALWKIGLGSMVTGLVGFYKQAKVAQLAMGSLTTQAASAGIAMKAALAGSIIYTTTQLVLLTKEIYEWRKAVKAQEESQKNLTDNTSNMMRKFAEFKGFKLPADITKASQQDLDEFRKKLASARAYYTALKMQLEQEGGNPVALEKVKDRLKEIQTDFKKVGEEASGAAGEMQKPAEAINATKDQLKSFEEQAKKAYEEAKKQAADYAQKVIEFEDKIKFARLSTKDQVRELGRLGMTDAQKWADMELQAEQKLAAAKAALRKGDFELAEKLAGDAEKLYAGLATEVKGTDAGKEVVVKSLKDTKQIAIDGVEEVGKFVEKLYKTQKDAAQTAQAEWQTTAEGIKAQLDEIAKQREANVQITLSGIEAAQSAINNFIKNIPDKKTIIIEEVHVVKTTQAKATGGIVGAYKHGGIAGAFQTTASVIRAATGKILPGFGGGDKIRTILEAGEGILRKEAIAGLGKKFFFAYNRLDVPAMLKELMGKKISGFSIPQINMPSMSRLAFADGGIAPKLTGSNETFTLRLQAGDVEMPLNVMGNKQAMRGMIKEFEKELIKLGMVKR
jgi:TP901 family phage tail tape measure protein